MIGRLRLGFEPLLTHLRSGNRATNRKLLEVFCSTSLLWTSTRRVPSTIKLFCTVHSLSRATVDKSQQHWFYDWKLFGSTENRTRDGWEGNINVTSELCRPPSECLSFPQAIGCHVVNMDSHVLSEGRKHIILGLLWQIIAVSWSPGS